jgi:hypothetical protein
LELLPSRLRKLQLTVDRGRAVVDRLTSLMNAQCSPTHAHAVNDH